MSNSWVQVEVFEGWLFIAQFTRQFFRKTNKQTKNIKSQSEYPIRLCLVVLNLAVLKQCKEQAA